ncbi:MAG: hypothetical protein IPJ77_03495 [Planctomycetes bacterium]|nr:hypothetical protein [Planctomycetota bacterium]
MDPIRHPQGEPRVGGEHDPDSTQSGSRDRWSGDPRSIDPDDDAGEGHKGPRTDLKPSTTEARAQKDHDQPAPATHAGSMPGELTPKAPRPNPQSTPGAQEKPVGKNSEPRPTQTHGGAGSM